MGAWGIRTFENDDAADWLAEFTAQPDPLALRAAFDAVVDRTAARPAAAALAAAEVLAAWCGRPAPEIPPTLTAWCLGRNEAVDEASLVRAREVVDRVLAASELRTLWDEAGELEAWRSAVADLRHRLGD